eukprot:7828771-Pyramimonas_sp.AAC.1
MQARPRHFFDDLVGDLRVPRTRVLRLPDSQERKKDVHVHLRRCLRKPTCSARVSIILNVST